MTLRKFSNGAVYKGERNEDEFKETMSGGMVIFDAWESGACGFAFRVWHTNPNLEIKIEGDHKMLGKEMVGHDSVCWCYDMDEEIKYIDYCTTIEFMITTEEGSVELTTSEDGGLFEQEAKVTWTKDTITDMGGNKAKMTLLRHPITREILSVELKEILSDYWKKHYAMESRIKRIRNICITKGLHDLRGCLLYQMQEIYDSANMSNTDFAKWVVGEDE